MLKQFKKYFNKLRKYCSKNPIKSLIIGVLLFLVIKNTKEGFNNNSDFIGKVVTIKTNSGNYVSASSDNNSDPLNTSSSIGENEKWKVVTIRGNAAFYNTTKKKYIQYHGNRVSLNNEAVDEGADPGGVIPVLIVSRNNGKYSVQFVAGTNTNHMTEDKNNKIVKGWHHENNWEELNNADTKPGYKFTIEEYVEPTTDSSEEQEEENKEENKEEKKDNTMLYLAIGGGAFLLIIVIMIMMKSRRPAYPPLMY